MADQTNSDIYVSLYSQIDGKYSSNLIAQLADSVAAVLPQFATSSTKDYNSLMTLLGATTTDPGNPASPLHILFQIYARTVGAADTTSPNTNIDIDGFITNPNIINDPNYAQLKQGFINLFNQFAKSLNWNIVNPGGYQGTQTQTYLGDNYTVYPVTTPIPPSNVIFLGLNSKNLVLAFSKFASTTAVVQNSSKDTIVGNAGQTGFTQGIGGYIQSYQDIYEAFNGDIDNDPVQRSLFEQRFAAFYQSEIDKKGYFQTGHDLADWYNYSQSLYFNPLYSPNAITSDPKGTIILNEVLMLLIKMIGTVQNVAAAQAGQLKFLSSWQASYTEKLNKIHTFSQGDSSVLGTFPTERNKWNQASAQQVRVQLNNVNQSYITKLQANQQTISDQAKALQTNVNQSNDAANQQGSVADSLLQTFSTIISAIFR